MALTWDDLAFSVVFNCGVALVCFIIFNVLRRLSFLSNFYMAKRYLAIPFRCASQPATCGICDGEALIACSRGGFLSASKSGPIVK